MDSGDEKDRSRERPRRDRDRSSRLTDTSRDRSADRGRDRGGNKSAGSNCRVFVSNIPYEFRWQDLKDLFRNEVGDVSFVELFVDDKDKSRGMGVVEFSEPAHVKKCLDVMNRFEVKGRKLVVKEDQAVRDKHGNKLGEDRNRGGRGRDEGRFRDRGFDNHQGSNRSLNIGNIGGSGDGKWGNTYGLSPNFLESLNIDCPLCNRVFVANLAYDVDKKKVKEVFKLAGKIQNVEIYKDKEGRSRGFAVVEYDHPVEAVQAISMFNNQYYFDRQMTVRMDRVNDNQKVMLPEGLRAIGMGLGTNGEPLKDVARNLPSAGNNTQSGNLGAGILGSVPNSTALQMATALTGLNSGLAGIGANNFSSLGAGNLGTAAGLGVNNLSGVLGTGLGNSDLGGMANNLVSNPTLQSQFAALTASNNQSNMQSNIQSLQSAVASNNLSSYGRSDNNLNASSFNNRTFAAPAANNTAYGRFGGNDRDSSAFGNDLPMHAPVGGAVAGKTSRKIIVSNLPTTASYKMLHDKFSEYGDVQIFEEKGAGTMLVMYGSEWQAERAIKNLDRARIDGRTIEARFF